MISCNTEALAIPAKTYRDPSETTAIAARLSISERVADCRQKKENLLAAIALLKDVPLEDAYQVQCHFDHPEAACLYVDRTYWQRFVE
ncbi:MAG: hypothetical protein WCK89_24490, partial [bacterium]